MISIDEKTRTITVRETPEMLSRLEEVLKRYDKSEPRVRLHFRIIEANGGDVAPDESLMEIEKALPEDIFRFKNYRLVGEAVLTGIEWSEITQVIAGPGDRYTIEGNLGEVRAAADSGTVRLRVALYSSEVGQVFQTTVTTRFGQLLVLGSAQPDPKRGAVILAVRAELERP
jgi:hypothetical protein